MNPLEKLPILIAATPVWEWTGWDLGLSGVRGGSGSMEGTSPITVSLSTHLVRTKMASLDLEREQKEVCRRFGATWLGCPPDSKVGISKNVEPGIFPLNGFREPPSGGTAGWYIWAGEVLSTDPNFFQPLHVVHLTNRCPVVLQYLGLPPGWRFLLANKYEDVWYDASLLGKSDWDKVSKP